MSSDSNYLFLFLFIYFVVVVAKVWHLIYFDNMLNDIAEHKMFIIIVLKLTKGNNKEKKAINVQLLYFLSVFTYIYIKNGKYNSVVILFSGIQVP